MVIIPWYCIAKISQPCYSIAWQQPTQATLFMATWCVRGWVFHATAPPYHALSIAVATPNPILTTFVHLLTRKRKNKTRTHAHTTTRSLFFCRGEWFKFRWTRLVLWLEDVNRRTSQKGKAVDKASTRRCSWPHRETAASAGCEWQKSHGSQGKRQAARVHW